MSLCAVPSISRAPTLARVPLMLTLADQSIRVPPFGPSESVISPIASTALPGAWPRAWIRARLGSSRSRNVIWTLNVAVMKPTPTLARALK